MGLVFSEGCWNAQSVLRDQAATAQLQLEAAAWGGWLDKTGGASEVPGRAAFSGGLLGREPCVFAQYIPKFSQMRELRTILATVIQTETNF